jgi:hypothetical protein
VKTKATKGLMTLSRRKPPNDVCSRLSLYSGYVEVMYTLLPRDSGYTEPIDVVSGPPVNVLNFLAIIT